MNFYRPLWSDSTFDHLFDKLCEALITAPFVNTGHWQGKRDTPMSQTRELQNVILELPIAATPGAWASWMKPNLPWAEDHFQERVSGIPYNPPPSHDYWPFNQAGNKDHMDGQVFSHTYPERLWPRKMPAFDESLSAAPQIRHGIRYEYGDLEDAISLLLREPCTRQCFIPIWFPEDLHAAARKGQRVPCTLGYHLMMRERCLNVFYPMRSLDLLRYARDDFYMAGRLAQWAIEELHMNSGDNSVWQDAGPGVLTVHAVSLHVFENDVAAITHRLDKQRRKAAIT